MGTVAVVCGNEQHALKFSLLKIPPKRIQNFSDTQENEDGMKVFLG